MKGWDFLASEEGRELFKKLWFSGAKEAEIARVFGISVKLVPLVARVLKLPSRHVSPPNKKLDDRDIDVIREMWMRGASRSEIARHLGVSKGTVGLYLRAMGLKRGREVRRCPEIAKEELERLSTSGHTDQEIARIYNTSESCIARLRKRYGIKKQLIRVNKYRAKTYRVETIINILKEKGFTSSAELKKYGIYYVSKETLQYLETAVEGFKWFKLRYTSTIKYSVLPLRFINTIIMYLRGHELKVINYLYENAVGEVPKRSMKRLLRKNNAPEELIDAVKLYASSPTSTK